MDSAPAIDKRRLRASFDKAAPGYDAAAVLQHEVCRRMLSKLEFIKLQPAAILDAGCGTGNAVAALQAHFPHATLCALDLAAGMVRQARARAPWWKSVLGRNVVPVCGDIEQLPLRAAAFDFAWSNLALQWMNDLPRAFAEFRRVLTVGGLLTFTTFGPDTLKEIRSAFARADGHTHTNRFTDMHDIGDMLVDAGFADPVMDMEQLTLTYADAGSLMRELKQIGATNATRGRPHGLMGRGRWRRALEALEATRRDGRIPATFEVIYGHAWKGEPRRSAEGHPIVKLTRPGR